MEDRFDVFFEGTHFRRDSIGEPCSAFDVASDFDDDVEKLEVTEVLKKLQVALVIRLLVGYQVVLPHPELQPEYRDETRGEREKGVGTPITVSGRRVTTPANIRSPQQTSLSRMQSAL